MGRVVISGVFFVSTSFIACKECNPESFGGSQVPKKTIYLVSTSHLDREWYFSFEKFRIQICQIINRTLELLAEYPEYKSFMLDGQVCPLLDYLEIYPEKEAEIRELIVNDRF